MVWGPKHKTSELFEGKNHSKNQLQKRQYNVCHENSNFFLGWKFLKKKLWPKIFKKFVTQNLNNTFVILWVQQVCVGYFCVFVCMRGTLCSTNMWYYYYDPLKRYHLVGVIRISVSVILDIAVANMDALLASYASSDEEVASKEEAEEEQKFLEGEFLSCVALPASMCDYVFFCM